MKRTRERAVRVPSPLNNVMSQIWKTSWKGSYGNTNTLHYIKIVLIIDGVFLHKKVRG